jgi:type IVB pilus formation R64 PilN family outer membrane protein
MSKTLYKKIILIISTISFLTLTGCLNSTLYNQSMGNVADVKLKIDEARRQSDQSGKPEPSMVVNQGLYVDKTPISLARDPMWLRNRIVIRGDALPFSYYSRTIATGGSSSVLTRYQVGLDPTTKVSMNYSGTVRGALDLLAARSGYVYTVNGNNIYWQAFVTKTYDIAFMPGSSDYQMGKSSAGGGAMPATGGAQAVNAVVDDSAASQYSSLKGKLSVWKDMETSIQQLLSPDGKVMVSESTTTITVRDRPTNVALVSKFIENINNNLSKQVLVKVQVLDITLFSDYNYGINWMAVKRTLGTSFFLNGNYGTPVSITPLAATTAFSGTVNPSGLPQYGAFNPQNPTASTGASALINALTQQGKVAVVTEPRVVCLNNQVSVIRIVNQQGYLASIQNTTVAGGSGVAGTITSQMTPGTVIAGLTLYILPKIMNDKVFLQVNADLSTLVSLTSFTSGTGGTASTIQLPNMTQKQFNQRSVIASGATLILSGFKQVSNTANAMQNLDSQALGGKGAKQSNSETIVLITPIILHGTA